MPNPPSSELTDACLRETLWAVAEDCIREVAGENADVQVDYLKQAFLGELHRDSLARDILCDTLKVYIMACVEYARRDQMRDMLQTALPLEEVGARGN